ncbi:MAG: tRNA 4-thiouridine(8) synthase ThiI [Deltaproteobacteria bacterium]|nr:tRNA 4-thiouridine(8) synthase ThiI [Deltaproteobacteria bacterium]
MAEPLFLCKVGELYLKGDNRPLFEKKLVASIERAVGPARIRDHRGKLTVEGAGHDPEVLQRLERVFGIVSIELAHRVETDEDDILSTAVTLARSEASGARTFRISTRRTWKGFHLNSVDLNCLAGAAVARATGLAVDLGDPDLDVRIEVGTPHTYVYTRRIPGAGGLPVGSSGHAVLLLSGGIDSPVAGWLAMKRGLTLDAVHFHSPPHTGPAALRKVRDLTGILASWQGAVRLHVVPFTVAQEAVRDTVREDYRVLIYRRLMVRIACLLAERSRARALVTGESLAQVASQTLENMSCIEAAAALPVLRPLVTYDKIEVIQRARRLSTYEVSIRPGEDCCALFVPRHPATRGRHDVCERCEDDLDVEDLVESCAGAAVTEEISPPS